MLIKRIAVIFMHMPHGTARGREGLDAVLAMSALTDDIGVFFIADGVLHLLAGQEPTQILARNYIATFGVLELYDIRDVFACRGSLAERGVELTGDESIEVIPLDIEEITEKLAHYDTILTF